MEHDGLIFDWNQQDPSIFNQVEICDETLRDGIQSPSVFDPALKDKLELISLMDKIGITIADIGLPGAGPRAYQDVLDIARFVRDERLKIQVNCAGRTVQADIEPMARIQQEAGIPIVAYCFLGTSPIRQMVEDWDIQKLLKTTHDAISFAKKEQLTVAFVTEDTIRSHPATLSVLFKCAIDLGVERLVLCDTVGHATPNGIKALVDFTQDLIKSSGQDIKLDWHGHNDRGLGVANALYAAEFGCHRIHGTALGVGERVGNTAVDQLLVNLKLLQAYPHDVSSLGTYVEKAAQFLQVELAYNYPVFGRDAFRTATGVHAAAVIKAKQKGQDTLADIIYSSVPAHWFGKQQEIEIGPMSGASNVKYWLTLHGHEPTEEVIDAVLKLAKRSQKLLARKEIEHFLNSYRLLPARLS